MKQEVRIFETFHSLSNLIFLTDINLKGEINWKVYFKEGRNFWSLRIRFWTILYCGKGTWRDGSSPGKCKCSPDVIDSVVNLKNSLGRGPLVVTLIASQSGNSLKQNLNNERIASNQTTILSGGGIWMNVRIKSRHDITSTATNLKI